MKILLTNDDGIYAQGLRKFYAQLKKIGNIDVVAPDSERSSVGHGITLSKPIFVRKINLPQEFNGYAISGTPADCVKLALKNICKSKPDLIVSGINLGPNDGHSVFYSGTVAGAREGALAGIPAIAFSLGTFVDPYFDFAARMALKIIKKIQYRQIPKGTFLNINIPNIPKSKLRGIKVTKQGLSSIHTRFIKKKDPLANTYFWMTGDPPKSRKKDDCRDTRALANNYITVTPIHADSTDYNFYDELINWKL